MTKQIFDAPKAVFISSDHDDLKDMEIRDGVEGYSFDGFDGDELIIQFYHENIYGRPEVKYIRADLVPKWQPIETAPKDGTKVILKVIRGVFEGDFYHGEWRVFDWYGAELRLCGKISPTHWLPLPLPPKE